MKLWRESHLPRPATFNAKPLPLFGVSVVAKGRYMALDVAVAFRWKPIIISWQRHSAPTTRLGLRFRFLKWTLRRGLLRLNGGGNDPAS